MPLKIGRNRNSNDVANVMDAIELNGNTTTVLLPENPSRIALHVNNNSETKGVWIKLQPASVDDKQKGIWLAKKKEGLSHWDMSPDNIYTGEVSAIADSGKPDVYATEY